MEWISNVRIKRPRGCPRDIRHVGMPHPASHAMTDICDARTTWQQIRHVVLCTFMPRPVQRTDGRADGKSTDSKVQVKSKKISKHFKVEAPESKERRKNKPPQGSDFSVCTRYLRSRSLAASPWDDGMAVGSTRRSAEDFTSTQVCTT
jgi:hypothetical protein